MPAILANYTPNCLSVIQVQLHLCVRQKSMPFCVIIYTYRTNHFFFFPSSFKDHFSYISGQYFIVIVFYLMYLVGRFLLLKELLRLSKITLDLYLQTYSINIRNFHNTRCIIKGKYLTINLMNKFNTWQSLLNTYFPLILLVLLIEQVLGKYH